MEFDFLILWNSGIIGGFFLSWQRIVRIFLPGLNLTRVTIPGVFCNSYYANGHDGGDGRDGGRCREGLQLGRAVRRENEVNPARSTPEGSRLPAGEAQVEAEGDEVTLRLESR